MIWKKSLVTSASIPTQHNFWQSASKNFIFHSEILLRLERLGSYITLLGIGGLKILPPLNMILGKIILHILKTFCFILIIYKFGSPPQKKHHYCNKSHILNRMPNIKYNKKILRSLITKERLNQYIQVLD